MKQEKWGDLKGYFIELQRATQANIKNIRLGPNVASEELKLVELYAKNDAYRHLIDMMECYEAEEIKEKMKALDEALKK